CDRNASLLCPLRAIACSASLGGQERQTDVGAHIHHLLVAKVPRHRAVAGAVAPVSRAMVAVVIAFTAPVGGNPFHQHAVSSVFHRPSVSHSVRAFGVVPVDDTHSHSPRESEAILVPKSSGE